MSYADAAASGPPQPPSEAAAPIPPSVKTDGTASTASLIDVDTPSVRTVPSDFMEQDTKTETQAARQEYEESAAAVRAEAELAKKKSARKGRKADAFLTRWFGDMSDGAAATAVGLNSLLTLGVCSIIGYKGYGLYQRGALDWKHMGIGASVLTGVAIVQGVFGSYLYKGFYGFVYPLFARKDLPVIFRLVLMLTGMKPSTPSRPSNPHQYQGLREVGICEVCRAEYSNGRNAI